MKSIIEKPHLFFYALAFLSILTYFFVGKDSGFDLYIFTAYFTIPYKNLCLYSGFFFLLIGFNYLALFWAKKTPKNWLTICHIIFQLIAIILLVFSHQSTNKTSEIMANNSNPEDTSVFLLFLAFIVFMLSILLHLINFFGSLLLKRD